MFIYAETERLSLFLVIILVVFPVSFYLPEKPGICMGYKFGCGKPVHEFQSLGDVHWNIGLQTISWRACGTLVYKLRR